MRQDELHPAPGSRKGTKRFGRGYGSGHGGYAGRGCKGQKARSSVDLPRGFEGGQIPLTKRLPADYPQVDWQVRTAAAHLTIAGSSALSEEEMKVADAVIRGVIW